MAKHTKYGVIRGAIPEVPERSSSKFVYDNVSLMPGAINYEQITVAQREDLACKNSFRNNKAAI